MVVPAQERPPRDHVRQSGSADFTAADFPGEPELQCDIVMKGGITSGVVYPLAVCELATTYRLRSVGGASAGAIAAAAAVAAEMGRRSVLPRPADTGRPPTRHDRPGRADRGDRHPWPAPAAAPPLRRPAARLPRPGPVPEAARGEPTRRSLAVVPPVPAAARSRAAVRAAVGRAGAEDRAPGQAVPGAAAHGRAGRRRPRDGEGTDPVAPRRRARARPSWCWGSSDWSGCRPGRVRSWWWPSPWPSSSVSWRPRWVWPSPCSAACWPTSVGCPRWASG